MSTGSTLDALKEMLMQVPMIPLCGSLCVHTYSVYPTVLAIELKSMSLSKVLKSNNFCHHTSIGLTRNAI